MVIDFLFLCFGVVAESIEGVGVMEWELDEEDEWRLKGLRRLKERGVRGSETGVTATAGGTWASLAAAGKRVSSGIGNSEPSSATTTDLRGSGRGAKRIRR